MLKFFREYCKVVFISQIIFRFYRSYLLYWGKEILKGPSNNAIKYEIIENLVSKLNGTQKRPVSKTKK